MSAVDVLPAVEVLARWWLVNHVAVGPLAPGGVHTQLPADFDSADATVTVQRVGGLPAERHRLDRARLEVQAWAADEDTASLVARTARAALMEMEGETVEADQDNAGFVSAVDDDLGLAFLPDSTRTPPTPRWTFGVEITARAVVPTS